MFEPISVSNVEHYCFSNINCIKYQIFAWQLFDRVIATRIICYLACHTKRRVLTTVEVCNTNVLV